MQATTLVETADQAGVLRDVAELLAEHKPEAAVVVQMYDRISAWFFPCEVRNA